MNRDRKAQYNQLMGLQKSVQQRVLRANKMDAHRRDLRVQKWAVQRGVAQTEGKNSSSWRSIYLHFSYTLYFDSFQKLSLQNNKQKRQKTKIKRKKKSRNHLSGLAK